jgi:glycosyltransferase involved in cell wall biosynthesis
MISVVMTTYNGSRYLEEQIESILGQTHAQFELLIADDRSTDATVDILSRFVQRDRRVRYYVNDTNLGINRNLSVALAQAAYPLVAISDQDDIWHPDKLERLVAALKDYSAVYSDSQLIDGDGAPMGQTLLERIGVSNPYIGRLVRGLLRKNSVSGHALLLRKELLDLLLPFDDEPMFDQQIGIVAALNHGLGYVAEPLVKHRVHTDNQTNKLTAPRIKGPQRERRRERRLRFATTLEFYLRHLERHQLHYWQLGHEWATAEKIATAVELLRQFDGSWVDFRLFLNLVSLRREIFLTSDKHLLRRCLSYAKGARYYR